MKMEGIPFTPYLLIVEGFDLRQWMASPQYLQAQ
jgi:hypothetical protein